MCGRITLTTPGGELAGYLRALGSLSWPPRYNIAPTQDVATVRQANGERRLEPMRWGLIPGWADGPSIGNRMINARAETVADRSAFREPFRSRRCLVLADGFYEWQQTNGGKQPHYLYRSDGRPLTLAGLWDTWRPPDDDAVTSCTIITTRPNDLVEPLHDRMPVILEESEWDRWLDPSPADPRELQALLDPFPPDRMSAHPVTTRVNSPANDDPDCIRPLERVRIVRPARQESLDFG